MFILCSSVAAAPGEDERAGSRGEGGGGRGESRARHGAVVSHGSRGQTAGGSAPHAGTAAKCGNQGKYSYMLLSYNEPWLDVMVT